jgi:hypothetical protein
MARIINILSRLGGRRGAKLALVALLVGMVTLQLLVLSQRGYSSDDVAQQTILSQWQRGYAQTAWVGDDNWYLKFPLYWVANQLDVTPYTRAMVTSWILTTTTMVGVLLVLWRVVELVRPPNRAAHLIGLLLPAVALLALAPTALYFISTNNTRNIEIPILLLLLYWLLRYDRDNRRPRRYVGLAIVGMAGLLLADDPIFKFMGLAALLAVLVWRWLGYRETTPRVLYVGALAVGAMLVSLLVAKAVEVILPLEYLVHPAQFTTIDGFYENARTMVSQNLELFGAHFWGLPRSLDAPKLAATGPLHRSALGWAATVLDYHGGFGRQLPCRNTVPYLTTVYLDTGTGFGAEPKFRGPAIGGRHSAGFCVGGAI